MAHSNPGSEGENLSRIKDILFGEDLQSIEQKLDVVKDKNSTELEKLREELNTRLKELELLISEKVERSRYLTGKNHRSYKKILLMS